MDYFILTNTEFFQLLETNEKNSCKLKTAYSDFIKAIFDLSTNCSNRYELFFAMTYAETELQSLCDCHRLDSETNKESTSDYFYLRKALSFIRGTFKHIQTQLQLSRSPLAASDTNTNTNIQTSSMPQFKWTGSAVELVELIYGFIEMRSINNGETPIVELASFISSHFGIEIKDCYSAYVDMKRRKNDSRTYYLDKMRERLNRRMEMDDERETGRR
jgi:hypothetical protein